MKCLVTGAAGFLGSHLCDYLLKASHTVVGVDDFSGGYVSNIVKGTIFVAANVGDSSMSNIFEEHRPDVVYHLACYAAEGMSHFIRQYNYSNNLVASANLINLAIRHKVKCFVFASSMAVYGDLPCPLTEDMEPRPADPYGVAKLAVEHDLRCARHYFGLPYVVFRMHNVYGPKQNMLDPYRNVVAIFVRQALAGQPLTIFGDGTQMRQFTYVDDIMPALAGAPTVEAAQGKVFNLGGPNLCKVTQLAGQVLAVTNTVSKCQFVPARDEVAEVWGHHDKLLRTFGVQRYTSLRDGLGRMVEWAREQRDLWQGEMRTPPFRLELSEGLPVAWQQSKVVAK